MMRLNRWLATNLGISRRQADKLINSGAVSVNGVVAALGTTLQDKDCIKLNNQIVEPKTKFTYLLLNKPVGYVCSRQGQGSPTIYELLPKEYWPLKPAGRLDKDSSGLLLLTDDGQLIYNLTHPSSQKTKTYEVQLNKKIEYKDQQAITAGRVKLSDGISQFNIKHIDGAKIMRPHYFGTNEDWLVSEVSKEAPWNSYQITMSEGRNRQIRRTFEALGYEVTRLHRTQIGPYKIGGLAPGKYELTNRLEP
jgi:23S rRNA pseudouridine2605 synthase